LREGCPFYAHDTLRFGPRRRQTNDLSLNVQYVARPDRGQPTQIVNAKADKRMRPEWPYVDG
jgi:hypothetical protein